jgi:hypothetical protein
VTVTVKLQLAVCPSAERAVTETDVAPTGNRLPDEGLLLTTTGATPPDVVGVKLTATEEPSGDATVEFAGHETASGVGATYVTMTEKLHVAV